MMQSSFINTLSSFCIFFDSWGLWLLHSMTPLRKCNREGGTYWLFREAILGKGGKDVSIVLVYVIPFNEKVSHFKIANMKRVVCDEI